MFLIYLLDSNFFSSHFESICLEFFVTVTSEKNCPVFVNMKLIFLLIACAINLVDSFPYKYRISPSEVFFFHAEVLFQ